MSAYRPTIGLEIHAELQTKTKMFCACLNAPGEKQANKHICPVCMAHPGSLPVINREAVKKVLLVGAALDGALADYSEFDRKNYFYPDIPKGYQISQYKFPLVAGGALCGVAITRVHLEEDTARSQHIKDKSLVDYNRAGVPLMELVSEPVIRDAETAGNFARELQLLLRYLGASEANMEQGQMRVEANISISKDETLGTKVEVKNLNSFRSVERAIAYEISRQTEVLKRGEQVVQETRGWDEQKQTTFSQRKKEQAHDYRYFPDPDLPSLRLSELPELSKESLARELPELPWQKRERLTASKLLQEQDIEQLIADPKLSTLFGELEQKLQGPKLKVGANYLLNFVAGELKKNPSWEPPLSILVAAVEQGLPSPQARASILSGTVTEVTDDESLPDIVKKVITNNRAVVEDYKAGKQAALQFLVGQGMKESKGSANPEALRAKLLELLG